MSHTHTHTHFRYRLVQIWFPTKTLGKLNCSLKQSTRTHGVILSFKSATHTHTLDTGWYEYGSQLKAQGDRILGAWYYQTRATSIRSESQQSPRDSKEDFNKVVLESWCYTRKSVQLYSRRIAAQFQGIASGVSLSTNSPGGGRGGPGGLELHQMLE